MLAAALSPALVGLVDVSEGLLDSGDLTCRSGRGLGMLRAGVDAPQVCFTAPHAREHHRDGRRKFSEPFTGGLAVACATALRQGAVAVVEVLPTDANWDAQHPLKDVVGSWDPSAVVDLHMMSDAHGPDVCLGRGAQPHLSAGLLEALEAAFIAEGFTCTTDWPFQAATPSTVTSHFQARGHEAIQVELAARTLTASSCSRDAVLRALTSGVGRYLESGGGERLAS